MNRLFPLYEHKTLDEFQIFNVLQEKAVQAIRDYNAVLPDHLITGRGLTIVGEAGLGKTHLAQMVLKEAMAQGYSIECIELASYIQLHHDKIMWSQQQEWDNLERVDSQIRRIRFNAKFVLLDDIGREYDSTSGWGAQILFNTLRFRANRKRPFLVTSNLSLSRLSERYSEGMVSHLREMTQIIPLEGDDYRCAMGR